MQGEDEKIVDGHIMGEGAENETSMYFVVEGSKTVVLEKGGVKLGRLSGGDFFGELAALLPPSLANHRVRTRSAYAIGETQLGVLDYDDVSTSRPLPQLFSLPWNVLRRGFLMLF